MKKILAAISIAVLFSSCVPSTPQARIQQSPRKYAELSGRHQELVRQGQITRGMAPDAVYLAWGAPAGSFQGSRDGKTTERWDYAGSRPVYMTNVYGGYGYGHGPYGPYGPYGYSGIGVGLGPEVAYVPYRVASVWFVNRKVDSWERAR